MEDEKLVSVIMPSFNCEEYIFDAINSVLNQTYKNIELIIVDDCSSDKTLEIIKSFDDSRIKSFVNEKNKGPAFSRNLALQKAKGEFIAFLDGDDVWEKDKLTKQINFMVNNNYNFSYTQYIENNLATGKKILISGPKKVTRRKFLRCCYIGCLTSIYKKQVFPDLQIPDNIKKRNDYALWLKLSERANCYLLKEPLGIYNKHSNSVSSNSQVKLIKYHYFLFRNLYKFSKIHSLYCTFRNVVFVILKKTFYRKRIN